MKILSNHYSPETAYLVNDYPYGFTMRCKIRYWLEVNSKGTRFCSQTSNPKKNDIWNKEKKSTYSYVGAMFLNDEGHVTWTCFPLSLDKLREFLETYREGLSKTEIDKIECMLKAKAARGI